MNADRRALLNHIESQFTLESVQLEFQGRTYSFHVCADDEQVMQLSDQAASNDASAQPYWGQIWESSIGLCHWLSGETIEGKSILDLGCGLGIAGALAASREADVVSVDAVPAAIELAKLNVWPWRNRAQCQVLNWHTDRLDQNFDFIVGADIVYDREDWPSLNFFWRDHLNPGGQVMLVEPTRQTGYEFAQWIATQGWQLESAKPDPVNDVALQMFKLTR